MKRSNTILFQYHKLLLAEHTKAPLIQVVIERALILMPNILYNTKMNTSEIVYVVYYILTIIVVK
jgi:hypothetical protein